MNRIRRARWVLLGAMAALFCGVVYFGSRIQASYRTPLSGCAYDSGTGGGLGIYRWVERLGIPVRVLEVPVWEAEESLGKGPGQCVLTMGNGSWSPMESDLDDEQWKRLRGWISAGNTLIVVTSAPSRLPDVVRNDLITPRFVEAGSETGAMVAENWANDQRPETSSAIMAGGASLTVAAKGPRWNGVGSVAEAAGGKAEKAADSKAKAAARAAEFEKWRLAGDSAGGVLFRVPVGKGAIVFLLDSFAWTNTGFDQGENARALAEVLDVAAFGGGVLAIDEYRHGHGRSESFLVYLLRLRGSRAVFWLLGIWAMVYLYGRNVRLLPAELYQERERRTAQEYIDAVAQLYQRARAAPLVVEAVARRLEQLGRASAEPPAAVTEVLERAEAFSKAGARPSVPTAGIRLVTELNQIRKEIYGTRTLS